MTQYFYICEMITTLSLVTICHHTKLTFRIYSLDNFHICSTMLLTIVTNALLSIPMIYLFITGSLRPPSPVLPTPQVPSSLATTILEQVFLNLTLDREMQWLARQKHPFSKKSHTQKYGKTT